MLIVVVLASELHDVRTLIHQGFCDLHESHGVMELKTRIKKHFVGGRVAIPGIPTDKPIVQVEELHHHELVGSHHIPEVLGRKLQGARSHCLTNGRGLPVFVLAVNSAENDLNS